MRSWTDVPAGVPAHHHCHAVMEWSHDPDKWRDMSGSSPDLLAWHPTDASAWARNLLVSHHGEAEEAHGRLDWLEYAMKTESVWERQERIMGAGHWSMLTFALSFRRILVLWMLSFADGSCRHARP